MRELFDLFQAQLHKEGLITRTGTIVDETFVEAPAQRNSKEERETIKKGEIPEEWQDKTNKLRQKDTDARWTKKNGKSYFGYKDHVKADAESKLIEDYKVTNASVRDSKATPEITERDNILYADSAYCGQPFAETLPETVVRRICKQGRRNHPLTEAQKQQNKEYAKVRCRIEHIFGFMTGSMGGLTLRSIGLTRAEFNIGLTNLIYNMFRYEFLHLPKKAAG